MKKGVLEEGGVGEDGGAGEDAGGRWQMSCGFGTAIMALQLLIISIIIKLYTHFI